MANPGLTTQRFAALEIINTLAFQWAAICLSPDFLYVFSPTTRVPIIGNGKRLTAYGLGVLGLDLDNVLLTLNLQDQSSEFDDVVFRNYPDTAAATRITIASGTGQYSFNNMNFVQGCTFRSSTR
jgi:hypothetical protein